MRFVICCNAMPFSLLYWVTTQVRVERDAIEPLIVSPAKSQPRSARQARPGSTTEQALHGTDLLVQVGRFSAVLISDTIQELRRTSCLPSSAAVRRLVESDPLLAPRNWETI